MLRSIGDNIIVSSVKNNEYEKNGIIVKTVKKMYLLFYEVKYEKENCI